MHFQQRDVLKRFERSVFKPNRVFPLQTPHEYNLMWILSDVVSAVLIVVVFVFHW